MFSLHANLRGNDKKKKMSKKLEWGERKYGRITKLSNVLFKATGSSPVIRFFGLAAIYPHVAALEPTLTTHEPIDDDSPFFDFRVSLQRFGQTVSVVTEHASLRTLVTPPPLGVSTWPKRALGNVFLDRLGILANVWLTAPQGPVRHCWDWL